jgi:protein SCO1/2
MNRRAFAFGLPALALPVLSAAPGVGGYAELQRYFANVAVKDQSNRRLRFYDDLVKGKTVLINFMFTTCGDFCPRATQNLARVQDGLGERLGRDIFMVSVSLDPRRDTPRRLARYATDHHARPGWHFVTGAVSAVNEIRNRLGAGGEDKMQHTGIVLVGNEPAGRWRHFYALSKASDLAEAARNIAALRPRG